MATARPNTPLIAVIDDDEAFLEAVRDLFESEGYRVVTGRVPEEAPMLPRACAGHRDPRSLVRRDA